METSAHKIGGRLAALVDLGLCKTSSARWRKLLEAAVTPQLLTRLTGAAPSGLARYVTGVKHTPKALKQHIGRILRGEAYPHQELDQLLLAHKLSVRPDVAEAQRLEKLFKTPGPTTTIQHGTSREVAEQIAQHGPKSPLLELRELPIGRFGKRDPSGLFVHHGEQGADIASRLRHYAEQASRRIGSKNPVLLEFEFPTGALRRANVGYEAVIPESLWPLAKNVRIKTSEFAPGIPVQKPISRLPSITPKTLNRWTLAVQDHEAARAKRHFDLRLVDPDAGKAHSWAIPKARLPKPGEKLLAVQTFTHTPEYALHFGEKKPEIIPQGYGKGRVRMALKEPVDIVEANNDKVHFNIYQGKSNEEFILRRTKDNKWLLQNVTLTKDRAGVPQSKPKYKETEPKNVDVTNDNQLMMAKVDGSHVTLALNHDKPLRIFSYRPTERNTGIIEHTHRFLPGYSKRIPKRLDGLVLRGELFASDPLTGRTREVVETGATLNSGVWKSRERQQHAPLRAVIFDVARRAGKDVESLPYTKKLKVLRRVNKALPFLELPPMAETPRDKIDLLNRIRTGQEPITSEGVVLWPLGGGAPIKAKFRPDHDVYVREIFPETGKREGLAGGFRYSWTPRGKIVGHVGTGLRHNLKRDMLENPSKYLGRVARVRALGVYRDKENPKKPGALRAPSFQDWHIDRNMGKIDFDEEILN